MEGLLYLFQSITLWASVGAIVVFLGVVVVVFRGPNPKRRMAFSPKQRMTTQAREAANRFNFWIKTYYHYGQRPDTHRLLEWLETDRGHTFVEDDYRIFTKMAGLLRKQGYKTLPPPTREEFEAAVARGHERESHRRDKIMTSPTPSE